MLKQIKFLLSLFNQIKTMKNLKNWQTTVTGLAVLISQGMEYFHIALPSNITEILVVIGGALLLIAKDPNAKS